MKIINYPVSKTPTLKGEILQSIEIYNVNIFTNAVFLDENKL